MKMFSWALAAILLLPAAVFCQTVTLPKEVQVHPEKFNLTIIVTYDGDFIRWDCSAPERVDVDRMYSEDPKEVNLKLTVYNAKPGEKFLLKAWTAKVVDGKAKPSPLAVCAIVVPGVTPTPPGPGPGPDPGPGPGPNPPGPSSLVKTLKEAFALDGEPDKAAKLANLGKLYRKLAENTVPDTELTTAQQVLSVMHDAAKTVLADPARPDAFPLANFREAAGKEIRKIAPTTNQAMTPADRKVLATKLIELADSVQEVLK